MEANPSPTKCGVHCRPAGKPGLRVDERMGFLPSAAGSEKKEKTKTKMEKATVERFRFLRFPTFQRRRDVRQQRQNRELFDAGVFLSLNSCRRLELLNLASTLSSFL